MSRNTLTPEQLEELTERESIVNAFDHLLETIANELAMLIPYEYNEVTFSDMQHKIVKRLLVEDGGEDNDGITTEKLS